MTVNQLTSQRRTPAHEAMEAFDAAAREGLKFTRLYLIPGLLCRQDSHGKWIEVPQRAA